MSTTMLGDCSDCEDQSYRRAGSVIAKAGVAFTRRADAGIEVLWVPQALTTGDRINVTFLMGALQFRPWVTRGFFLKTSIGAAFLENWLSTFDDGSRPIKSTAFALGLGAGWEWRLRERMGVQLIGAQHVASLGDLETSDRTIENVMGNFWSIGGTAVFR